MKLFQEKEKALVLVTNILKDSLWSALPPETEERSNSKQDRGPGKTESEKTANTSSLDKIQSAETKRSTPLQIQKRQVGDKTESELKLADASAEDKAQSQETKETLPYKEQTKLKKTSVK